MDKRRLWMELAATVAVAWLTLPPDTQVRLTAGCLHLAGHVCRGAAAELGRAAMACERRYYEVVRP